MAQLLRHHIFFSRPSSIIIFSVFVFFFLYFFLHMLDGHILYMSELDCSVCIMYKDKCNASINGYHLQTQRLKIV